MLPVWLACLSVSGSAAEVRDYLQSCNMTAVAEKLSSSSRPRVTLRAHFDCHDLA